MEKEIFQLAIFTIAISIKLCSTPDVFTSEISFCGIGLIQPIKLNRPKMLNLEWFRTFKAIYETGTLSAAAQVLAISQPGVGLHLNSLESYAGYRLFDRETRRMVPTDRGIMLYTYLNDPISKLEKAEEVFYKNSKLDQPTLSIGMCYEHFVHGLQEDIASLPFNLIVHFGDCQQILHELDTGALDLVLTFEKGHQLTVEYEAFAKENIMLICGSATDTSGFESLEDSDDPSLISDWLKTQVWYTTSAEMEDVKKFWSLNFGLSPDFRPNFVVPYYNAILPCIAHQKGFALMPESLCMDALLNNTVKLPWNKAIKLENTLYFGSKVNNSYQNEISLLQDILRKKWRNS